MAAFTKVGLDALLTPDNCLLVLIDHQPFQLANVNSHEPTMVINNVTALAKAAKAYGFRRFSPQSSRNAAANFSSRFRRSFPSLKPIDRTLINSWEDGRVVAAVKKTSSTATFWRARALAHLPAQPPRRHRGHGFLHRTNGHVPRPLCLVCNRPRAATHSSLRCH